MIEEDSQEDPPELEEEKKLEGLEPNDLSQFKPGSGVSDEEDENIENEVKNALEGDRSTTSQKEQPFEPFDFCKMVDPDPAVPGKDEEQKEDKDKDDKEQDQE